MAFLSLFFAFLFAFTFSMYVMKKTSGSKTTNSLALPPGPKTWPFFGCLLQMIRNKPAFKWIHGIMREMNTDIACIRLGKVNVIVVTSPELGREFLKNQDSIFSSRPLSVVAELVSSGYLSIIFSPYGDQWKKMRRVLVSNLISPSRECWLQTKIVEEADHLIYYLYNQCKSSASGGVVNIRSITRHYSANVMRRMVFSKRFFGKGMEDGGAGAEEDEHVDALFTIVAYLHSFGISDYLPWIKSFDIDGHQKIVKRALRSVRKFHDPEIEKRIQMWDQNALKNEEEDLLDVLITLKDSNSRSVLTAEEIKALIIDLMIATVDNPSNCVEWVLAEMMNQPEMLERATEELDTVVGKERLVDESDLKKLNYIKACAREAFRLHPIAPFNVPHVSKEDTTAAGYFIPKGSHILLSRLALGQNPRIWKEPLKFMPERHLKDKNSNVVLTDPELNMFSFSTGRRGCPGVMIGSTMTTLMLARLLQCFTWTVPPGVSRIELAESKDDLFLRKPLLAFAKPRLARNLYPEI